MSTGTGRSSGHQLRWSSGYDARLTRERSPVQSWDEVCLMNRLVLWQPTGVSSHGFVGLVVMTLASHARGPQFNPGTKYFVFRLRGEVQKAIRMRTPGIEPGAQAWEACMLPLHYERSLQNCRFFFTHRSDRWSFKLSYDPGSRTVNSLHIQRDTLAEWLRRRPAKPVGSAREGSNPSGVEDDLSDCDV